MKNREIKFRGMRIDGGNWIEGSLILNPENKYPIIGDIYSEYEEGRKVDNWIEYAVDTDTVGQFTGLLDKNGKEIYEGDVLKIGNVFGYYHDAVRWNEKRASFWLDQKGYDLSHYISEHLLVIGNIHQNPELL